MENIFTIVVHLFVLILNDTESHSPVAIQPAVNRLVRN